MLVDYKIKAKVIFYNNTDHRLQKKINLFQIKFIRLINKKRHGWSPNPYQSPGFTFR